MVLFCPLSHLLMMGIMTGHNSHPSNTTLVAEKIDHGGMYSE
jgi:hypothetical protein